MEIMSTSFVQGESEHNELLDDKNTSNKVTNNTRNLRIATAVLASVSRFRRYLSRDYEHKKSDTEIVGSPSETILDVKPKSTPEFKTDPTTLRQLVEEENVELLQQLGGVNGIAEALNTDLVHGIQDKEEDIERRLQKYGANTLPNPPKENFFQFVWQALLDFNIFILITCGSVTLGLGIKVDGLKEGLREGGSILFGVFVAVIVIATSNCWHNKVFKKVLKDSYKIEIDVVRGGQGQKIPVHEIVVGDVVSLKYGDKVPAHGLIIEEDSLKLHVDKTGGKRDQGDDVELNLTNQNRFLFSGTEVVDGYAWMLVTSVGMNAKRSQIIGQTSHDSVKMTRLETQLEEVDSTTELVGYVVTLVVVLLSVTGTISFTVTEENGVEKPAVGLAKIYAIVSAIVGLITSVVNITDPLRLSLKITRAYAMKKLKAKNAMVRELSALENMSFVDTICICTNKTGTLTEFRLGTILLAEETYSSITPKVKKLLQEGIALNTLSYSPTEKAICSWADQYLKMDVDEIKRNHDILHIVPFDSKAKQSGILTKRKTDNTSQVHFKGSAKSILAMCSCYYDDSGTVKDLDKNARDEFEQAIRGMEASRLSCIAFAHNEAEARELQDEDKAKMLKDGKTLLGIAGISDPLNDALTNLKKAKLNIKMITDDNIFTAKAIAEKCEILESETDSGAVIEGEKFRSYSETKKMNEVDKIFVMASSSPSDKLSMVRCLKAKGHVVAVVGNSTNDSLAMKEADIGVFMGIRGNEVTEESSGIVISDDNLCSIPEVLKWGRCVYSSMQKFIQFQITASFSALLANFVGLFSVQKLTLTAVQLLWVSLITETLACLAFATEKPTKELMENQPVSCKTDPIVTNIMLMNILPQALFQIVLLSNIQSVISIYSTENNVLLTFVFTSYVLCQVFNQINSRKLETKNVFEKIHTNKLFLGIAVGIIVLQILLVETLKIIVDTERLNWPQWGLCIGVAALTLPIGLVAKFIPVPKKLQVMRYLLLKKGIGRLIREKLASVLTWLSQIKQRYQQTTTNRHKE